MARRPSIRVAQRRRSADRRGRHLVTDARGTPLGVTLSGANRHDSRMLVPTLDAVPGVRARHRGRRRRRPTKLHADQAYDHRRCRSECRARGITPRIARRGIESSTRLGRHRPAGPPGPACCALGAFAWLAKAGSLSAPSLGSSGSDARPSATSAAPICTSPSPCSPVPSSACASSGGFVLSFKRSRPRPEAGRRRGRGRRAAPRGHCRRRSGGGSWCRRR